VHGGLIRLLSSGPNSPELVCFELASARIAAGRAVMFLQAALFH
jgi:hypothetical protein